MTLMPKEVALLAAMKLYRIYDVPQLSRALTEAGYSSSCLGLMTYNLVRLRMIERVARGHYRLTIRTPIALAA